MVEVINILIGILALMWLSGLVVSTILFSFMWVVRVVESLPQKLQEWFVFR